MASPSRRNREPHLPLGDVRQDDVRVLGAELTGATHVRVAFPDDRICPLKPDGTYTIYEWRSISSVARPTCCPGALRAQEANVVFPGGVRVKVAPLASCGLRPPGQQVGRPTTAFFTDLYSELELPCRHIDTHRPRGSECGTSGLARGESHPSGAGKGHSVATHCTCCFQKL